jgi:hypothetical protein
MPPAFDAAGDGQNTRGPGRAWPYSYLLRCRTRQHCKVLVQAAIAGKEVPLDVWAQCPAARPFQPETPLAILRDYVLEHYSALYPLRGRLGG